MGQRVFLSRHLPHSLAHRVAQLAVEFSSRRPTAAAGLCPHQLCPSRRENVVAMPHQVLTIAVATSHQAPPPTDCCRWTISPPIVSSTGMIAGQGYAPPIMLRRRRPSSWACGIRCTRRSTIIGLGKQLTIGPDRSWSSVPALAPSPFVRVDTSPSPSPLVSIPVTTRHGSRAPSKEMVTLRSNFMTPYQSLRDTAMKVSAAHDAHTSQHIGFGNTGPERTCLRVMIRW